MAAAAGGMAFVGSSFLMEGPLWPIKLVSMLGLAVSDRAPERMPNLRGLAWWMPGRNVVEVLLAAAVIAVAWRVCATCREPEIGGAVAGAAGLLLGHHAYLQDSLLLVPLLVLILDRPAPAWLHAWTVAVISPAPYFALLSNRPYIAHLAIVGFVLAAMGWLAVRRRWVDCNGHSLPQ